jgi:hypothetical protein
VASPSVKSVSTAAINERLLADAMAASIPEVPGRVVAGALTRAYVQFEHAYGAAWGAIGQPAPSGSVSPIAGGFKMCWPDTGDGAGCDTFT